MVDASDELFGDWCELNFAEGITPGQIEALCLDYRRIQEIEADATAYISSSFLGDRKEEITLFIPSVVTAIEEFRSLSLRAFK